MLFLGQARKTPLLPVLPHPLTSSPPLSLHSLCASVASRIAHGLQSPACTIVFLIPLCFSSRRLCLLSSSTGLTPSHPVRLRLDIPFYGRVCAREFPLKPYSPHLEGPSLVCASQCDHHIDCLELHASVSSTGKLTPERQQWSCWQNEPGVRFCHLPYGDLLLVLRGNLAGVGSKERHTVSHVNG